MLSIALLMLALSFGYVLYAPVAALMSSRNISLAASRMPYTGTVRTKSALSGAVAQRPPQLEIHVANNGLVLLRGALVTAVSGTTLTLEGAWGKAQFVWEVQTDTQTKFFRTNGSVGALTDIHVGDTVMATGNIDSSESHPTIRALYIRE